MVSVSMKTISSYLNIFIHVLDFSNWRINSTKAEAVCKSHNARVLEIELRWLYFLIKNLMLTAIEDFLQYCQTWIRHPPGFQGSCPNEDGDNESPPKGLPGFSNLLLSHFNLWSTGWRQRLGTRSWIQKATYAAHWCQFADSARVSRWGKRPYESSEVGPRTRHIADYAWSPPSWPFADCFSQKKSGQGSRGAVVNLSFLRNSGSGACWLAWERHRRNNREFAHYWEVLVIYNGYLLNEYNFRQFWNSIALSRNTDDP